MTDAAHAPPASAQEPILAPWSNIVPKRADPEIAWINGLQERARPISPTAWAIRNLITRFEICHFKIARHLERILDAIGSMQLDLDPATIGRAHPRSGEQAWRLDRTGHSRIGQEYIWILQLWLTNTPIPANDPRAIPHSRFTAVHTALGPRDARKTRLVTALIDRMRLHPGRQPLAGELQAFQEQIERMDICHYAFPRNLDRMIQAIGALQPVPDSEFNGCGSCGEDQREIARRYVRELVIWLHRESRATSSRLGDHTPVKEWLVASLAKTLKEHAALADNIVHPAVAARSAGPLCRPLPNAPLNPGGQRPGAETLPASGSPSRRANPENPTNPSTALEPMITRIPAFQVLGTLTRITPGSESGEKFAAIWNAFEVHRSVIQPHSTDRKYYGVSFPSTQRDRIDYLAGMAVRPVVTIPAGLALRDIPGATYAVFACPIAAIGPTYRHIFGEWHPRSNLAIDELAPGFEQYPPAEDLDAPVLIHIPVHAPDG